MFRRIYRATASALGLLLLLPTTAIASVQAPYLVRDIHPTASSSPSDLATAGGLLFFAASDGAGTIHDKELWVSDGTAAGTKMVADINPGPGFPTPRRMTAVRDRVFFSADDGTHGRELWVSDGTTAGTYLVRDINPGLDSADPFNLTVVGDLLFFSATDGVAGVELWVSDGTTDGTKMVADINPGAGSSVPNALSVVGELVFFSANDGAQGSELWVSDGTEVGTKMVADINPGLASSSPNNLTVVGDLLFFSATNVVAGVELWVSDGATDGTKMVADINPGVASASPNNLTVVGDLLFFTANDGVNGFELWAYQHAGATTLPGAAAASTSTITASSTSVPANGTSTVTITVQAKDANSTILTAGNSRVTLATTTGTLSSPVTDNKDGTYTATLTSATTAGTATITGTLNEVALASTSTVAFTSSPTPETGLDGPAGPDFKFTDVSDDSIHTQAIYQMRQYGILVGTSETTFDRSGNLRRSQMSMGLVRLLMLTDPSIAQPADHDTAMAVLADKGLLLGDIHGNLNGTGTVTRGQAASLLARVIEHVSGEVLTASELAFLDVAPTHTHAGSISKLVAAGVNSGYANNTFRSGTDLRRDQMASLIVRTIDLLIAFGDIEDFGWDD